MDDFIYSRHLTPVGIRMEIIEGGATRTPAVARLLATQVYCENGTKGYRAIEHFDNGAPYGEDEGRISVSHTEGIYVVASLPRTPESDLSHFSPRTAMGVDVEKSDRRQVLNVRSRFLSEKEQEIVTSESTEANILAWTAKEAMMKACMDTSLDIRKDISILSMPDCRKKKEGEGLVHTKDGTQIEFRLYSCFAVNGKYVVTIAYSPKCASYKKSI